MADHWTAPLAYHITFTTYGTWLHGDERGSYSRKAKSRRKKFIPPDALLLEAMQDRLKHPVVVLDTVRRSHVHGAIVGHCEFKGWPLLALNVRTNHVHLVVEAKADPSRILNSVKARATRKLRNADLQDSEQPVWTTRGNVSLLRTNEAVEHAIDYVNNRQ